MAAARRTTGAAAPPASLGKRELLNTRICDLGLSLQTSPIQPWIQQLYTELADRQLRFKPHFWFSDDWFCPDGIPGVAIPFYLGHRRLIRLEREMTMDVEGGDKQWCMNLLRHETAHALLNAYRLDKRADWRKTFGNPAKHYPETYQPRPYDKRFVLNLPNWYAQSHPHEDWAETFAVWLRPNSDWQHRYAAWPAIKKLRYVERLIDEIHAKPPSVKNRRTDHPVSRIRTTLREYYADKLRRYDADGPEFIDRDLYKLFGHPKRNSKGEPAAVFLLRVRKEVIESVEYWGGEYRFRIDRTIRNMAKRAAELGLQRNWKEDKVRIELVACLTMLVVDKMLKDGFHITL
ncbi:MAG: putative zinc-binding metallopeptidase [Gammaproteobacteria bacterium]|nr:putative zinc-binding metallopeptidase [Gammaproteobacteria bacterium]MDH5653734.1 putative zinc-binding metallopeptidase [Gammaproteobacteria bacterium]